MRLIKSLLRRGTSRTRLEIERARHAPRRVFVGAVALASLLFLASVVFGADELTGLSGRPSIQRATAW
jgi:hypothetical protein